MNRRHRLWSPLAVLVLLACCCLVSGCTWFNVKAMTFTGSSAHWKAQCVVQVKKLDESFHMSSRRQLKIWWTDTSGDVTEAQYQLTGLHGMMEQASSFLGPFHPWVSGYTGSSEGLSDAERDYGFFLTITWKGGTETLHLQSH